MIQNERDCRHEHVLGVARQMMTAARTAPKGKGVDVIETALVTGSAHRRRGAGYRRRPEKTFRKNECHGRRIGYEVLSA